MRVSIGAKPLEKGRRVSGEEMGRKRDGPMKRKD